MDEITGKEEESSLISQDDIEQLLNSTMDEEEIPETEKAKVEETGVEEPTDLISQDDIDSLFS